MVSLPKISTTFTAILRRPVHIPDRHWSIPLNGLSWCERTAIHSQKCNLRSILPLSRQVHLLRLLHAGQCTCLFVSRFPDDFPFAFEVEIHRPVINPICPVLCQDFAGDNTIFILADFTICPFSTTILLRLILQRRFTLAMNPGNKRQRSRSTRQQY